MSNWYRWALGVCIVVLAGAGTRALTSIDFEEPETEKAVERKYVTAPAAPAKQTPEGAAQQSAGCLTCHTKTDAPTMHASEAGVLGCADCHGGDPKVMYSGGGDPKSKDYRTALDAAHVLPRYPKTWAYPSSANPVRSYALLNRESPEFVRFINPSDYRIAREACGA